MILKLTARIESTNPSHAQIGVFQNGGKAGVLCVDLEHAETVTRLLNNGVRLLAAANTAELAEIDRAIEGRERNPKVQP